MKVQFRAFLTLVVDGGDIASRPGGFPTPPGDEPQPRYSLDRKVRGPQSMSGRITRGVKDNFIQNFGQNIGREENIL